MNDLCILVLKILLINILKNILIKTDNISEYVH